MSESDIIYVTGDDRLTTYPIIRHDIFNEYKAARDSYWTPNEIATKDERDHFLRLTPGEQHFVKHILAFFAASDGIVNLNLAQRFKQEIKILEVGYFYDFQIMMENIHAETYSLLLDTIIPDVAERNRLLNAIQTIPTVGKLSEYMFKCIASDAPIGERLLRMACVEGIFFTGCFCAIYWLQVRGLMPALGQSNELIARDEGLHTLFAILLYNTILRDSAKLPYDRIKAIFMEAVDIGIEFVEEALPNDLPEMNSRLMSDYIRSEADVLLTLLHHEPIYNVKHQFVFMDLINMTNRTNFFERRATEYSKSSKQETKNNDVCMDF